VRNYLFALMSLAIFATVPAKSGRADEVSAVIRTVQQFDTAWNRHDMKSLAALYADDADFVNVIGLWWHGRDEIRNEHVKLHQGRMKQTSLRSEKPVVRMLSPSIALVHVKWTLRGDAGAPGWKVGEVRRGILTHVLVKQEGTWKIVSTQNTDIVDIPNN
jgi:uncharacterized protein (TIGR02246 family)